MTVDWKRFKVNVPEGESGDWCVEKFEVSEQDAKRERLRAMMGSGRGVPAGHYTRLMRGRQLVMSDTPDEIHDHLESWFQAKANGGSVLIHGLGLGMIAIAIAELDNVTDVTVIERSADVIKLVGPMLERFSKVTIVHADAYTWQPPKGHRYQVVWHDIWDDLCTDNLPEMTTLHRRYGRRCDWQGSWGKHFLEVRR